MSNEELSRIFDTLVTIKEFCLGHSNCSDCPFVGSPICSMNTKPCGWTINNPSKPIFKFF